MPPVFNMDKCSGCSLCDSICPVDAIYMEATGDICAPYMKYPKECWHC